MVCPTRRSGKITSRADDGQFDARVLDLDCCCRFVRGRSDGGLPLRKKGMEAARET